MFLRPSKMGTPTPPTRSCSPCATQLGRVVFTQDDDFLALADQWQSAGRRFVGVGMPHDFARTVGQIVMDLQMVLETSTSAQLCNSVLFFLCERTKRAPQGTKAASTAWIGIVSRDFPTRLVAISAAGRSSSGG